MQSINKFATRQVERAFLKNHILSIPSPDIRWLERGGWRGVAGEGWEHICRTERCLHLTVTEQRLRELRSGYPIIGPRIYAWAEKRLGLMAGPRLHERRANGFSGRAAITWADERMGLVAEPRLHGPMSEWV